VIAIEELGFTYPDGTAALEGIDVAFGEEQVSAILGESGSGNHLLTGWLLELIDLRLEEDGVDASNAILRLERLAREQLPRGLRVAGLARLAGLSVMRSHRRFRRELNLGPGEFHDRLRDEVVTDALAGTDAPVAGIARLVGFTNPAAFGCWFGKRFGSPPSRAGRPARRPRSCRGGDVRWAAAPSVPPSGRRG